MNHRPQVGAFFFLLGLLPLGAASLLVQNVTAADLVFAAGERLGIWDEAGINESSGIIQSLSGKNIFWTHNDNGNKWLACAQKDGTYLGQLNLSNSPKLDDTEDICTGPGPVSGQHYIYYADVGDNSAKRSEVRVLRFIEPEIEGKFKAKSVSVETLIFKYPDGSRDCESVMVDPRTKDLYFVSNRDNPVRLYVARYPQPIDSLTTLEKLGDLPISVGTSITGGDMSADGSEILLRRSNRAFYWYRGENETVLQTMSRDPVVLKLNDQKKGEAICRAKDGSGFYTSSEGDMFLDWYKRLSPSLSSVEQKTPKEKIPAK